MKDYEIHMNYGSTKMSFENPKVKCPKCGEHNDGRIDVAVKPYTGHYCLRCYAKWVSENIPKLEG